MKSMWQIQFQNKNTDLNTIGNEIRAKLKEDGYKVKDIDSLDMYFKPETDETFYAAQMKSGETVEGKL